MKRIIAAEIALLARGVRAARGAARPWLHDARRRHRAVGVVPPLLAAGRTARAAPTLRGAPRCWAGPSRLFAVAQLAFAIVRTVKPKVLDIATTTLAAIVALRHGGNPYALPIDPLAGGIAGAGGRVSRLQISAGHAAGLCAARPCARHSRRGRHQHRASGRDGGDARARSRRASGGAAAGLAAAAVLSQPAVSGVPAPRPRGERPGRRAAAAAGAAAARAAAGMGGRCWSGLSIAAKLMPGLAVLPCLCRRRAGGGAISPACAAGLVPILPFVVGVARCVRRQHRALQRAAADRRYQLALRACRRGRAVAARAVAAGGARRALCPGLAASAGARRTRWRRPRLAILLVFAVGPDMHHNYYLWFIPFLAVLAGARRGRGRGARAAVAPRRGFVVVSSHVDGARRDAQ